MTSGQLKGHDWKIYDVGGARHQRQAWAPYFDDGAYRLHREFSAYSGLRRTVDAIIFLAPISAFDQVLAEVRLRLSPVRRAAH